MDILLGIHPQSSLESELPFLHIMNFLLFSDFLKKIVLPTPKWGK